MDQQTRDCGQLRALPNSMTKIHAIGSRLGAEDREGVQSTHRGFSRSMRRPMSCSHGEVHVNVADSALTDCLDPFTGVKNGQAAPRHEHPVES